MKPHRPTRRLALVAAAGLLAMQAAMASEFKVLVVMSYEAHNPWVREIREGIESVLRPHADITYFHMDVKERPAEAQARGEQAFALYQQLRPHGVITADDAAAELFIVPHLKDKVTTPVMFNGINADPAKYGLPNSHISGVIERAHVHESLAFVKQMLPDVQTACALTNDVPPGQALRAQVMAEKDGYPARFANFHLVRNAADIEFLRNPLRSQCGALFVDSLEGIADAEGKSMNNRQVLQLLASTYSGPLLGGNRYQVEQGAWAAVVKTGQEQGERSADMLLQAMRGTPVAKIPVAKNNRGQRVINATAIETRGIALRAAVVKGAALVKQQP